MHRRNEMEARINIFHGKSQHAIKYINMLMMQTQGFVQHLNCDPTQLKDNFLKCMKQLDEYIYLMTDFNISLSSLDANNSMDLAPVLEPSALPQFPLLPINNNLMDMLSEPLPSTSTACYNQCPTNWPKQKKSSKNVQTLIQFSSTNSSAESMPITNCNANIQCDLTEHINKLEIIDNQSLQVGPSSPVPEGFNLPAQTVLQVDHVYPATIMCIEGTSLWIIVDNIDDVYNLMTEMTEYYKRYQIILNMDQIQRMNYCAYYDNDSDCYYRAIIIQTNEIMKTVEVFLVDTGEVCEAPHTCIQPLVAQYCAVPPYARCCHLAGVNLLPCQNKELVERLEAFMKSYNGSHCSIEIDDNSSETLGVNVILENQTVLNNLLVDEGLVQGIDKTHFLTEEENAALNTELDVTEFPEHEDPVEAVTGYHNRDESEICKHYKGGAERACFKGSRCKKKHIMMHPDGWTLDQVEVPVNCRILPLPAPATWHKAVVTCVCHFNMFYIQFVDESKKDSVEERAHFGVILPPMTLESLVKDMNSKASRMALKPLKIAPAIGEMVVAFYPLDGQWYRARVLTFTPVDRSVEVMYVDYGNVVWIREDEIKELEPRFLSLPIQAVCCHLAGVKALGHDSKQWAEAKKTLSDMILDQAMSVHVVAREYDGLVVELYDKENYSIAEQLAAANMVILTEIVVEDDSNVTKKIVIP